MLKIKYLPTPILWALGYFLLLGLVTVILGQDISWDLRNYHFYNPYMLLTGRMKYDVLPAQIQTFFNPLIDVPFFVAIHHLGIPPIIVGFILGGLHGLNILFVHYIVYFSLINVTDKYRHILSFITAITAMFGAGYLSELGTVIGDNTTSLFVLLSVLIIISGLFKEIDLKPKHFIGAGFFIGLGTGLKLTVALYAIALFISINFLKSTLRVRIENLLFLTISMFVGFAMTAGYWMYLMWTNFASPLFPFYNTIFKSPYIETDYNLKDLRFLPKDIWQKLFYPFYFWHDPPLVAELPFRETRFSIIYILTIGFLIFVVYKNFISPKDESGNKIINSDAVTFLLPFFLISYLVWLTQFSIYRYLIPLELLTPVLIVLIIGSVYPFQKQVLWASITLFTIIIVTVKPLDWWRTSWADNYFGIDKQSLTRYENATIVLWGDEPTSYIVPHFPQSTRFVRIKGNSGLKEGTLMQQNAKEFIQNAPPNSLYFLERDIKDKYNEKAQDLATYNVKIDHENCYTLKTRIEGENYIICSLKK